MKARLDAIIKREQAEYLEYLHPPNTGLLAEMESFAAEHHVPIADREVALFFDCHDQAIFRHAARQMDHRIDNGHSAFQHSPGFNRAGRDFEKQRNLTVSDG